MDHDNSGTLFKREDKKKDTWSDYNGKCTIDGVEYYMDAWIKRPEGKKPFMSFSFKPVNQTQQRVRQEEPVQDDFPL